MEHLVFRYCLFGDDETQLKTKNVLDHIVGYYPYLFVNSCDEWRKVVGDKKPYVVDSLRADYVDLMCETLVSVIAPHGDILVTILMDSQLMVAYLSVGGVVTNITPEQIVVTTKNGVEITYTPTGFPQCEDMIVVNQLPTNLNLSVDSLNNVLKVFAAKLAGLKIEFHLFEFIEYYQQIQKLERIDTLNQQLPLDEKPITSYIKHWVSYPARLALHRRLLLDPVATISPSLEEWRSYDVPWKELMEQVFNLF